MHFKNALTQTLATHSKILLNCKTQEQFFSALHAGHHEVSALIPLKAHTAVRRRWLEKEVEGAFSQAGGNQRVRRAMEALLLPSTSVALPTEQFSGVPEYLWTFCLPMRITLSPEQLEKVTVLHGNLFPVESFLASLEQSGVISDKAILGGFTSLYRREDLFAYGPLALTQSFIDAESENFEPPHPLPIIMDKDLPGNVTVTCMALLVARMPLGDTTLFNSRMLKKDTRLIVESEVLERLRNRGIAAAKVEVDQLTHLTEMYLHSGGPLARELEAHLETLRETFGDNVAVVGRVPAPGYFELNVVDESSTEHEGIAAFSTLEPPEVLATVLEKLCERTNMAFKSVSTTTTMELSPQLH